MVIEFYTVRVEGRSITYIDSGRVVGVWAILSCTPETQPQIGRLIDFFWGAVFTQEYRSRHSSWYYVKSWLIATQAAFYSSGWTYAPYNSPIVLSIPCLRTLWEVPVPRLWIEISKFLIRHSIHLDEKFHREPIRRLVIDGDVMARPMSQGATRNGDAVTAKCVASCL